MNTDYHGNDFLLQCASTYNWEVLILRCSEIKRLLTSLASSQRLVTEAKMQLSQQDQYGNNVLHAACYNTPPSRAITAILNCAALAKLQIHAVVSHDGSTPLAIACATGADIDVIRLLLDPPAGLDHGGSAITISDSRGCTPLSELTSHYELQQKAPWHARTSKALDQVQYHDYIINDIRNIHNNNDDDDDSSTNNAIDPLFKTFWMKVELLVKAAWFHANEKNNFNSPGSFVSMLHGTAYIAQTCPEILSLLIGRFFPKMASVVDRQGLLPIHYLVFPKNTQQHHSQQKMVTATSFEQQQRRTTSLIRILLELYPNAATMKLNNGRSVLCQAIASGLHWNIGRQHTQHQSTATVVDAWSDDDGESMVGPVQLIWRAYPLDLWCRDVHAGLYPFMLAASSTKTMSATATAAFKGNEGGDVDADRQQLDTIYGLIRAHPQLLSELTACSRSIDE